MNRTYVIENPLVDPVFEPYDDHLATLRDADARINRLPLGIR